MFKPGEFDKLLELVKTEQPVRMLEIGCHIGRTASIMLNSIPSLECYIGVDVFPDYVPGLGAQRKEIPQDPGMLARGDSRFRLILRPRGSFDVEPEGLGEIDVAFVDGDHSREVVESDCALCRAVVRPGGLIIWHDYGNPGADVTEVLDRDRALGRDIQTIDDTWLALERV